jgi:hypothetical protein
MAQVRCLPSPNMLDLSRKVCNSILQLNEAAAILEHDGFHQSPMLFCYVD